MVTPPQTVLLVEDDSALHDAFSMTLRKNGYTVESAFDGKQALEKLKTVHPNVILLDLLMPVMNGREFLRAFPNSDNVPIIVFSNLDSKAEVQEVMQLGASRYMLKAWATPKELVRILEDTTVTSD